MKKRRILSALLAAIMLSALPGCGNTAEETTAAPTDTTAAEVVETEETRLKPDLPEKDFGGHEFTMLTKGPNDGHWFSQDAYAEELTGEPINDAVYNRNIAVGERYNFTVAEMFGDTNDPSALAKQAIQAGDDLYDLLLIGGVATGGLATGGLLMDLTQIPHMDLSKPWYDQSANADLSIGGMLHLTAGDLNIMDNKATWALLFNKKLAEDLALGDLYGMVLDGTWTLDTLESYLTIASIDLNGDGVHDEFDQWGMQGESFNTAAYILGAGERFFDKDENDMPYITAQSEKFFDAFEKANAINGNFDVCMFVNKFTSKYPDVWGDCMDVAFTEGRVLFTCVGLNRVTMFREMETDFGILPLPKYDEEQEQYHDLVSLWSANMISVPKSLSDPERTGIIIEALSAESMYTLTPAFYDVVLKTKAARDEDSAAMLDLIFEARAFELGNLYGWGGLLDLPGSLSANGKTDLASSLKSKITAAESAMQKTIDALMAD